MDILLRTLSRREREAEAEAYVQPESFKMRVKLLLAEAHNAVIVDECFNRHRRE